MKVKELIEQLQQFDPESEVTSCWDCITTMPMNGAIAYDGRVVIDAYGKNEALTADDLAAFDGKPTS